MIYTPLNNINCIRLSCHVKYLLGVGLISSVYLDFLCDLRLTLCFFVLKWKLNKDSFLVFKYSKPMMGGAKAPLAPPLRPM